MLDLALIRAIRYIGTEKILAEALGVTRQNVNYWKNHALTIPYRHVLEIERLTKGVVTRYDLAPHEKNLNKYVKTKFLPSIEERVRLGIRIEKEIFNTKCINEFIKNKKTFRRHKRKSIRESIANYVGFDNASDYAHLKSVIVQGIPELLRAVEEGRLSLYYASVVSKLPQELQKKLWQ